MSEVRTSSWGGTLVFLVDEINDHGELREASFFSRAEAERFAAEQAPAEQVPAERVDDSWVQGMLDAVADVPRRLAEAARSGRRR